MIGNISVHRWTRTESKLRQPTGDRGPEGRAQDDAWLPAATADLPASSGPELLQVTTTGQKIRKFAAPAKILGSSLVLGKHDQVHFCPSDSPPPIFMRDEEPLDLEPGRLAALREEADLRMRESYYDHNAGAIDWFDRLATDQPQAASGLVLAWMADLEGDGPETRGEQSRRLEKMEKIALVLSASTDHPASRSVVAPHAQRLSSMISRLGASDRLGDRQNFNPIPLKFCKAFVKAFPEFLDRSFLDREISVLLLGSEAIASEGACEMMTTAWEQHPELVAPTVALVTGAPGQAAPSRGHWKLLEEGFRRGWRPDADQVEWLLASAFDPAGSTHEPVFFSDRFRGALKLLRLLGDEAFPLLDGLEMPDTQGRMRPVRRALFDRVFHDVNSENCSRLLDRRDPYGISDDLYRFVFPDPDLVRALLEQVERGAALGPLSEMSQDEQAALAVLASLDLDQASKTRFESVLCQHASDAPGPAWIEGPIGRGRSLLLSEQCARLFSGELPFDEARDCFLRAVEVARPAARVSPGEFEAVEKVCLAWAQGLAAGPGDQQEQALRWLFERVEPLQSSEADLRSLAPGDLACLGMLDVLSRQDALLQARLRGVLGTRLETPQGYQDGLAASILRSIRKTAIVALMADASGGRFGRLERLARAERIGGADLLVGRTTAHDLGARGLKDALAGSAADGLARLARVLVEPESVLTVYRSLAPSCNSDEDIGREGVRFLEVMDRVGGEAMLSRAIEAHAFVEEAAARGHSREAALALALDSYARGTKPDIVLLAGEAPPQATPTVEREGGELRIGGISLPVRPG